MTTKTEAPEYLSYPGWKAHETEAAAHEAARALSTEGIYKYVTTSVRTGIGDPRAIDYCTMTRTCAIARYRDGVLVAGRPA
jgi:hypothetical protein